MVTERVAANGARVITDNARAATPDTDADRRVSELVSLAIDWIDDCAAEAS